MNNAFYDRLYALIKKLYHNIDADGKTTALLYACSRGLALIRSRLDEVKRERYIDTMSEAMLNRYCAVTGVSLSLSEQEKREAIKRAVSAAWQEYNADAFIEYYNSFGDDFSVIPSLFSLTLYGLSPSNSALFHEIMKTLALYIPPCVSVKLNGSGLTFEQWDSYDWDFEALDYMDAPFSILETL